MILMADFLAYKPFWSGAGAFAPVSFQKNENFKFMPRVSDCRQPVKEPSLA
jgi:hypothetical protein